MKSQIEVRTSEWQHRIPGPDHPGNLEDPSLPVAPMAIDYVEPSIRPWHHHQRGQLLYASEGVMQVETGLGTWIVAPEQAVWVPPTIEHRVSHKTRIYMRTLYIDATISQTLQPECCVVNVSPMLSQLILRAMDYGIEYQANSPEWRLMMVILDELGSLPPVPMHLPHPSDPRLARIAGSLLQNPADCRSLAQWASQSGASERTLARLFVSQTGMTFGSWRERLRLIAAVPRLVEGESVTRVALDLGYQSTSAFIAMFRRNLGTTPASFRKSSFGPSGLDDSRH